MIGAFEDAQDYKAFEAAIIFDYDASSAVERELVLRLASLLWRLRRATSMETGLFEIHADNPNKFEEAHRLSAASRLFGYACLSSLTYEYHRWPRSPNSARSILVLMASWVMPLLSLRAAF